MGTGARQGRSVRGVGQEQMPDREVGKMSKTCANCAHVGYPRIAKNGGAIRTCSTKLRYVRADDTCEKWQARETATLAFEPAERGER